MPQVNPEVLKWARLTAGLNEAEAVDKLGLKPAHGLSAEERLSAMEEGTVLPTRPLLLRMAKQYRRPLLAFYPSRPPEVVSRGQDFRTLPDEEPVSEEAILDALLRDVQARQATLRAALEDDDLGITRGYVGSASTQDGPRGVASSIESTIQFSLDRFRSEPNASAAFALLREQVEEVGVFVLLIGDLGSHHTALDVDTFRGFALADPVAPFVVINDHDARSAWSFTLLHELAHVWLGQTGVSGGAPAQEIERFCNDVASELLLPAAEIRDFRMTESEDLADLAESISRFAALRRVSSSMVAYKLYRQRKLARPAWESLRSLFEQHWLAERDRQRADGADRAGLSFYVVRRHRLGAALVDTTARLMAAGTLTTSKAGQVLGLKPHQVGSLIYGSRRTNRAS